MHAVIRFIVTRSDDITAISLKHFRLWIATAHVDSVPYTSAGDSCDFGEYHRIVRAFTTVKDHCQALRNTGILVYVYVWSSN